MIAVVLHIADLEEDVDLPRGAHVDAVGDDGVGHGWAGSTQGFGSIASARTSICSSSSVVNAGPASAATFSSICAADEAPISAEATTGSRSTHWIANCASVCPRSLAMTSSPRRVDERLVGEASSAQRRALLRALGAAVAEVLVGEQSLGERREGDRAEPVLLRGRA